MKKLENTLKTVTMNRFTLLGYSLITTGLVGAVYSVINLDIKYATVSSGSVACGILILSGTDAGIETYRVYERTKEYIQKNKRLDEEVVKLYSKFYCERQGVYMAAKELGHLDEYKALMKGKKVTIPNF